MKGKSGGRYFLRGHVFWIAYFDGRGTEIRESAKTKDQGKAAKMLEFRLKQIHKSQLDHAPFTAPKLRRLTVAECLDRLQTEYKLQGKWHDQLASNWKVVRERFGTMACERITKELIQSYQLEQKQEGAANATINLKVGLLLRSLKVSDLIPPRVPRLSEVAGIRRGFFEAQEVRRVLANLPPYIADAVLCLHLTGWRLSEVVGKRVLKVYRPGLQWSDKNDDMLCLPGERHKNRKPKKMPLTGELSELIARREQARVAGCDLIFHRGNGKPIGDFNRLWIKACRLAGCPGKLVHDLRRSRARSWIRAGVPERVAMELGGWRTRSVFDRYNITSENDMISAQEKTEVYLQAETEKQLKQISTVVQ